MPMQSRLAVTEPIIRPLRIAVAPRPQPWVAPVTFTWNDSHLVAAVHPGIRGWELGERLLDAGALPDWVIEAWLAPFGIHTPVPLLRAQWRSIVGPLLNLPTYPHTLPPDLRG